MSTFVTGKVVSGIGDGSHFVGLDWVREQILEKLGFDPYMGTLNVRMDAETSRRYHLLLEDVEGISIEPLDERYCPGMCLKCRIGGRIEGAVVVPLTPDYHADLLEIIAPVNLRESLGLEDGSEVSVEILKP